MRDAAALADWIEDELAERGTPERASGQKQYLKSDLRFLGATVGDTRAVTAAALKRAAGSFTHDDLIDLARTLWAPPVFERRLSAAVLLEKKHTLLSSDDIALLEELIDHSGTWALVDVLAVNVVGRLAARVPITSTLDGWSQHDSFWVRRASVLAEIRRLKEGAPFTAFARRADRLLDDKEFFIRKAIGWVLRETSKTRPDAVFEWLAPRTDRASGVTMREAVRYLDTERADLLMTAYREHRPAV